MKKLLLGLLLSLVATAAQATNPFPSFQLQIPESSVVRGGVGSNSNGPLVDGGSLTHTFWWTPPAAHSSIDRLADRVFIGPAVANDGGFYTGACPGSFCSGGFSNLDWLSRLSTTHYNGGPGVFQNGNFAQLYVLNDTSAVAPSPATLGSGVPSVAAIFGAQTAGLLTNATVYPIGTVVVNNPTAGQHPAAWGTYIEAHRVSSDAGATFGMEIETRDSGNSLSGETPYNILGGTIGLDIGCGAGLDGTGQFNCNTAMTIHANPKQWATGINFVDGGIGVYGPSSTTTAIAMPFNYAIQWYNSTLQGSVYFDVTGAMHLHATNGVAWETSPGGSGIASIDSSGNLTAIGKIRANGKFNANGTDGVSCSGSPTASFASINGIVTHC